MNVVAQQGALEIAEHEVTVDGLKIFYRQAEAQTAAPVLYVHGVPTHSADWLPFLERTGGIALDLPGFGRSDKPSPQDFSYSIFGYDEVLRPFLDAVGLDRFSLVVHDWGALALYTAAALADRVESVVVINAVPLLPGYRWHRTARIWRTPLLGELAMGFSIKPALRLALREANATRGSMPDEFVEMIWQHFDYETQRAILKLYRHSPSPVLAEAGEDLGQIKAPGLVVWGEQDPYIPLKFAQAYADLLPGARSEPISGAGHWPWLDRPETIDLVADFLLGRNTAL